MKRSFRMLLTVCLVCLLGFLTTQALGDDLGRLADSSRPIKIYIKDFVNDSGQPQIVIEDFKKEVAKAFANRKSVSFEIVDEASKSDLEVSGRIKQYQYLHRGPLKPTISAAFMLADAAATATSNYVEMAVQFAIIDVKTGAILWGDTISVYAKRVMTPNESIPVIFDKIARAFVSKSFGMGR
jgi:hypothetical protein